ncbi:MAG: hypothetical protein COA58_13990 [Bacteroidetes bacterium]|nr:MAG: hypothetical protein COA58_13990 [Bacteroidota bacterium]
MTFGDRTEIAFEIARNDKNSYSISLIIGDTSFGNPEVFGDLYEADLTMKRLANNYLDFIDPVVDLMSSVDFFNWLCGAGMTAKGADEIYFEAKRRHKHALKFGKSLMHYSIFCSIQDEVFKINFYTIKNKRIVEKSIEYKYVLLMAEEFNNWNMSLTGADRKIFEWNR